MIFLRALKWKCGIFLSLEGHPGNAEANTSRFTLWRAAAPCRPECALQIFSITLRRQKQITQVSLLSVILSRGFFKQTPLRALFTEITANLLKPAPTRHYCKWAYHHKVAPQSWGKRAVKSCTANSHQIFHEVVERHNNIKLRSFPRLRILQQD